MILTNLHTNLLDRILLKTRKIVSNYNKKEVIDHGEYRHAKFKNQEACDLIKELLLESKPCMIGRFGSVELNIVNEYCNSKLGLKKYLSFILGNIDSYKITDTSIKAAINNAGIFPANKKTLIRYSKLLLKDMKEVDVLGSWQDNEKNFEQELSKTKFVRLPDLEPYYHDKPWTSVLKGKDVLVVHPFVDTIRKQYHKKELLFKDPNILPDFNLKTIKSVQSIAGNKTSYTDWFEALDFMKKQIDETKFDIAIIGCGAYGFSLAAHVKRIGKKSIHLGGATQILFGIKGARWLNHEFTSSLFNKYWLYPDLEETPNGFKNVEGGCYW